MNIAVYCGSDFGNIERFLCDTFVHVLFFHQFLLTDTFPFSVNIKIHPLQHDNTAKPTLSKKVSCESPKAAFLHG